VLQVVVIDSGIDMDHPDLNVVEFVDFADAPGSINYTKDGNGHGEQTVIIRSRAMTMVSK
jgi:hypothetical protein